MSKGWDGMVDRYLTPAEINRVIPELERVIRYLRSLENERQEKEWYLKQAKVAARRDNLATDDSTFMPQEAEIDFLSLVIQEQFDRVRALGGEMKGGYLVDFPGQIDDEFVLYCWKPGEKEIRWYHGLYEGMMGRKPVPEELLADHDPSADAEE